MKPTWKDAVSSSVSSSWIVQSRPGPGRSAAATPHRSAPGAGIPRIVRTSGVITAGMPGAEQLTGSTRNSCANPSSTQAEQRHLLDGEIGQMGGKSSWTTGIRVRIRSVSGSAGHRRPGDVTFSS